ncbi:MAG: response regulator transcription factor [Bacteroidaceae bacterium]|nr:response regulator transcription factor [Bacteroidaceae bacterium]MBQ8365731.1 response regulator transcription factor [Bacteroidaceae bacterium]
MERILVVDDEPDLCEILKFNLENSGYAVDTANSGEEALAKDVAAYNLFLLDVMMDDMSGFTLASCLRKIPQLANTPIVFITAKGDENDVLTGFNVGADDYIHKPFRISEVIARVRAVLRRRVSPSSVSPVSELVVGNLSLNPETKRAAINGEDISLTKKEFEVLHMLLLKPGKVYSREEILARVWPDDVSVLERSIDVNMARLRKKLGPYASNIVSRSGYGYCFIIDRNE